MISDQAHAELDAVGRFGAEVRVGHGTNVEQRDVEADDGGIGMRRLEVGEVPVEAENAQGEAPAEEGIFRMGSISKVLTFRLAKCF